MEKTIDQMYVGQFALLNKTITDADVHIFAGVTGDMNPVHLDDLYASCSIFSTKNSTWWIYRRIIFNCFRNNFTGFRNYIFK